MEVEGLPVLDVECDEEALIELLFVAEDEGVTEEEKVVEAVEDGLDVILGLVDVLAVTEGVLVEDLLDDTEGVLEVVVLPDTLNVPLVVLVPVLLALELLDIEGVIVPLLDPEDDIEGDDVIVTLVEPVLDADPVFDPLGLIVVEGVRVLVEDTLEV